MNLQLKNNTTHLQPFISLKLRPVLTHNDAAKRIWISLLIELEDTGLSKKDIAEKCHISLKTLQRLESGEVKKPSYATFKKLLAFYCSSIMSMSEEVSK